MQSANRQIHRRNSNSNYLVPYGKFRKFPQAEQRAEGAFLVRGPAIQAPEPQNAGQYLGLGPCLGLENTDG